MTGVLIFLAVLVASAIVVFVLRTRLFVPWGWVDGRIGFAEVLLWSVLIVVPNALWFARDKETFGKLAVSLTVSVALVDLIRTQVLVRVDLVGSAITSSELMAWTVLVGTASATFATPSAQEAVQRGARRFLALAPRRSQSVLYAVLWIGGVIGLAGFAVAGHHRTLFFIFIGLVNGGAISLIALQFAGRTLYRWATAFFSGLTVDNLGAKGTFTASAIDKVSEHVNTLVSIVTAQVGPATAGLEAPVRISLWTTVVVIVAALLIGNLREPHRSGSGEIDSGVS